jgi:threonyl-tRNA synthetase
MNEERKTLEERAQMTDVERLRHSAAHVLATAILCHSSEVEEPLAIP